MFTVSGILISKLKRTALSILIAYTTKICSGGLVKLQNTTKQWKFNASAEERDFTPDSA